MSPHQTRSKKRSTDDRASPPSSPKRAASTADDPTELTEDSSPPPVPAALATGDSPSEVQNVAPAAATYPSVPTYPSVTTKRSGTDETLLSLLRTKYNGADADIDHVIHRIPLDVQFISPLTVLK